MRIDGRTKQIAISLIMISVFVFTASYSYSQSISIDNGISWLASNQNPDGSWGSDADLTVLDTSAVLDTLSYLNVGDVAYSNGITWISSQFPISTDFLSRKVTSLYMAGVDISADLSTLVNIRNSDGGWGGDEDSASMINDTTLALQALKAVNYPDLETISYALNYLITNRNTDGGWGFTMGDDASASSAQSSNVYMTALVSMTLQQFSLTADLASAINSATDYLISQQQIDGSWFTVYETSLAYMALAGETTDATVLGNAVNYLTETQLTNGSWNEDPYSTALALKALYLSENTPPPPPQPTTGTVTGTVVDASTNQPLSGVSVVLQSDPNINTLTDINGDFTLSDISEGSQTIDLSLTGYTTATVTVDIVAGTINNLGTIPLSSDPAPTVGDTITITATIYNTGIAQVPSTSSTGSGQAGSGYITVQFYDGDPEIGGMLICSLFHYGGGQEFMK